MDYTKKMARTAFFAACLVGAGQSFKYSLDDTVYEQARTRCGRDLFASTAVMSVSLSTSPTAVRIAVKHSAAGKRLFQSLW